MQESGRRDVSEKSDHLFRMLFESSPDAIFIEDLDGRVLDCNPAAAQLHGATTENIIGKHVSQLVPADRRENLVGVSDATPVEFEGYSLRIDGLAVPVSIRTGLIEYLGKPALLLHVRDITDRKRQEFEMRRVHEALEYRLREAAAELARAMEALRVQTSERERLEQERRRLEERIESLQKQAAGRKPPQ
jgi:PAS domain S-box-containing protein